MFCEDAVSFLLRVSGLYIDAAAFGFMPLWLLYCTYIDSISIDIFAQYQFLGYRIFLIYRDKKIALLIATTPLLLYVCSLAIVKCII